MATIWLRFAHSGLHFYSLNKAATTREIWHRLKLDERKEIGSDKKAEAVQV